MDEAELFKSCRQTLGLSVNDMARALAMANSLNVRRWENGRLPVSGPALVAVQYMLRDAGHETLARAASAIIAERKRRFVG